MLLEVSTVDVGRRLLLMCHHVEMDMVERIIRETTAKSSDGRIDQADFMNYSNASTRYSLFTPMESSIIFHFASHGSDKRLALLDFAQLLNPRWRSPHEEFASHTAEPTTTTATLHEIAHSVYNFGLGGAKLLRIFLFSLSHCIQVLRVLWALLLYILSISVSRLHASILT